MRHMGHMHGSDGSARVLGDNGTMGVAVHWPHFFCEKYSVSVLLSVKHVGLLVTRSN